MFVEGAKLSMGDMHFSQGDGEVSFCGAIEMSGFLELKCAFLLSSLPLLRMIPFMHGSPPPHSPAPVLHRRDLPLTFCPSPDICQFHCVLMKTSS